MDDPPIIMESKRSNDPETGPAMKLSVESGKAVYPNDELRRKEILELTEGLVMLEVRVKNLETSGSGSRQSSAPQNMRKSQSDRALESIKEELKQVKLTQERRSDAIETCQQRHEKVIKDIKSKTEAFENKIKTTDSIVSSFQKKSDSNDKSLSEINDRLDSVDKSLNSINERFHSLDKMLDERFKSVDDTFKSVDERFKSVDKRLENIESQLSGCIDNFVRNHSLTCEKITSLKNDIGDIGKKIDNLSRWLENTLKNK